jgi:hypothetical protein
VQRPERNGDVLLALDDAAVERLEGGLVMKMPVSISRPKFFVPVRSMSSM